MQKKDLLALLEKHTIPFTQWGTGDAKTFDHLLLEIQKGEATLRETERGLLRCAEGSMVMVYHIPFANGSPDSTQTLQLKEDRQVFKDGREKRRTLQTSIGEKMQPGESALEAAYRALSEELGITELLPLTPKPSITKGPIPSESYPGLLTRYTMHEYEVFLPPHLYKPEGYVEYQEDKSSYFVWITV